MVPDKTKDTLFAIIKGKSSITKPWNSHKAIPTTCIRYMPSAIDSVSLVLMTFITCGKKAKVVNIAAILPIIYVPLS